ncbi:hypothetical protein [Candidatus Erwinia haradaeae]|uniref:hypothetical protein n=1 Tax=Candidatus Erwinia haradaeae TaxID=1922217 RepID=UPI00130022A9|nr:hypothetical protein [Candidatus Erwinia haradaeae]
MLKDSEYAWYWVLLVAMDNRINVAYSSFVYRGVIEIDLKKSSRYECYPLLLQLRTK